MLQSVFGPQLELVPFRHACGHIHGPVGYLLEVFCGVSALDSIQFKSTQESKSNGWVRVQNLINRRWPAFDQSKQLNAEHFRLKDALAATGKFRLTRKEVSLLEQQLAASNHAMLTMLGDEFVQADEAFSEELSGDDVALIFTDLCKSMMIKLDAF